MTDTTTDAPDVLTELAAVILGDQPDPLGALMVTVLQRAAEAPPSPLRDAVIAMAEQAWAEEVAETEAGTDDSKEA